MAARGDWRIGDAEREAAATALGMHFAAGRLSTDEFQARLNAIYEAATAADLAGVAADLPHPGSPPPGPVPGGPAGGFLTQSPGESSGLRRAVRRVLGFGALLAATGVTGMVLLLASLLGHGSVLVPALILLAVPVLLLGGLAATLIWVGKRAWRRGAWLEAVPAAAGAPWLGRAMWATRMLLVGHVFWRIAGLLSRPLGSRWRRRRAAAAEPGGVWYQTEDGGDWHQARVGDLRGTTR